jgi:hypothetical protein
VSCKRCRTQLRYIVRFHSSEQETDRITSSGASSDPSEESPIGEECATAVAEDDDDDEDQNMRRRGWSLPREEPEACPIEPVCQGSIS